MEMRVCMHFSLTAKGIASGYGHPASFASTWWCLHYCCF